MATLARPLETAEPAFTHWTEGNPTEAELAHIPGEGGWPLVGNTFKMLADPHGFVRERIARYGKVYKNRAFGGWQVALIGAAVPASWPAVARVEKSGSLTGAFADATRVPFR